MSDKARAGYTGCALLIWLFSMAFWGICAVVFICMSHPDYAIAAAVMFVGSVNLVDLKL